MNFPAPVQPFNGRRIENLKITKLILIETGTYNTQWHRPYHVDIRGDTVNQFIEAVGNNKNVSPAVLAGVANRIIMPSAVPEAEVRVANGWGTKRLRYMMEIAYDLMGTRFTEMVLGYTEYDGATSQGHLAPDMKFFVNSLIQTNVQPVFVNGAVSNQVRIANAAHVLTDTGWQPGQSNVLNGNHLIQMRPKDVFSSMETQNALYNDANDIVDTRQIIRSGVGLSRRTNNIATNYLASIAQGYLHAAQTEMDDSAIMSAAIGNVQEMNTAQSVFLTKLQQLSNTLAFFTMQELRDVDPGVELVKKVITMTSAQKVNQHHVGQTAEWGGTDYTTQGATIIGQAIPAIMMSVGITDVDCYVTNNTVNGQLTAAVSKLRSFSGTNTAQIAQHFQSTILAQVFSDLTFNNGMSIDCTFSFNLMGDSRINLSINGEPHTPFSVPTFADASFTPVLTHNSNLVNNVARQMNTFMTNLGYHNRPVDTAIVADSDFTPPPAGAPAIQGSGNLAPTITNNNQGYGL